MTADTSRAARPVAALLSTLLAFGLAGAPSGLRAASSRERNQPGPGGSGAPLAARGARSPYGAVASDTEESSRVAAAVLEAGGNAIDAAVAGAFALGAAAPGGSGLGGQTWMVVHTAAGEDVAFLSPLRAPRRVDVHRARAAKRGDVMTGPLAMTAPGSVATLARAHSRFGSRPWGELVTPAVAIAEAGYRVEESERLYLLIYRERIEASPALRPLYLTGECGEEGAAIPVPVGHLVVLPDLARTLRRLADAGPDDFYSGGIASDIAKDLERHSAFLRADELARVPASIVETNPLRGRYRDLDVLSLPAPGGGSLVIETLHILQSFPASVLGTLAWARAQTLAEAIQITFADARRAGSEEETTEGPFPTRRLLPSWGAERGSLIRLGHAIEPERLYGRGAPPAASDRETAHLAVVDREGNAVSLTQSLGRSWGSTHVTPGLGFPYNAFLEAYDLDDTRASEYLRPNAQLRTAVAPTIFLRGGRPVLVLGAAGGSSIPSAIANVAVGVFDVKLGVAEAVAAPRVTFAEGRTNRGMRLEAAPPFAPSDVELLRAAGYADLETYSPGPETGNFGALNAVGWDAAAGVWEAGAEPRRHGCAAVPGRAPKAGPSREGPRS